MIESRESELYLAEAMLRKLPEDVLAGLLAQTAAMLQSAGMLSETDARRVSRLLADTLKPESRAA